MERLALREQAAQPLLNSGWTLLYSGLTPSRSSATLLDMGESLQIPIGEVDEEWDLWLETCKRQLNALFRQWLESQGIEKTTPSRITGAEPSGHGVLKISKMLQVARW